MFAPAFSLSSHVCHLFIQAYVVDYLLLSSCLLAFVCPVSVNSSSFISSPYDSEIETSLFFPCCANGILSIFSLYRFTSLLPQVSSSAVRKLVSINCYQRECISCNISEWFSLFLTTFFRSLILSLSYGRHFSLCQVSFVFLCHFFFIVCTCLIFHHHFVSGILYCSSC